MTTGAPRYMIVGLITLLSCIIFSTCKGFLKQLNVMFDARVSFIVGIVLLSKLFEQFSTTINGRIYSIARTTAVPLHSI